MLQVRDVSKSYAGRPVLRVVSARRDQRLALTGPSGSGKTTLLNCLGGLDRPDSGSRGLPETGYFECGLGRMQLEPDDGLLTFEVVTQVQQLDRGLVPGRAHISL